MGRSATANTLEQISKQLTEYKNDNSPRAQSPFPLAACPWCGTAFERECFILRPSRTRPEEVLVGCASIECAFNLGRNAEGLPVLFVDEQLYSVRTPAAAPWCGPTAWSV